MPSYVVCCRRVINAGLQPDSKLENARHLYKHVARHLPEEVIENLAANAQGFSARDIKEVCLHAERKWAAKIIRNNKKKGNEMEAINDY